MFTSRIDHVVVDFQSPYSASGVSFRILLSKKSSYEFIMGCKIGKTAQSVKDQNEQTEPPPPAPTDPRIPLTAKQCFCISKSWKGIARAMEPTGINMFVKLFQDNEDLLDLFEKFQSLKITESNFESMELAQHASIVMTTLDESIRSLDNVDYLLDYLHSVGKLHHKIPGFHREYFWRIEKPFLAAVQETLGDRYTENMENIYKITIHFILETVIVGYDMGPDTKENSV